MAGAGGATARSMRLGALLWVVPASVRAQDHRLVIDDFASVAAWTAAPAPGVELRISHEPGAEGRGSMRLDYDFRGHGGYAIARRRVELDLPPNYAISFLVRGAGPSNSLEFKLADSTGENVWWHVTRNFAFPRRAARIVIPRRLITFAWGPLGGGALRRAKALELVVTATTGGRGTVWISELHLEPREPVDTTAAQASATDWRSTSQAHTVRGLTLPFGGAHAIGGVSLLWDSLDFARAYDVELEMGGVWHVVARQRAGHGGHDYVQLPDAEGRAVRITPRRSSRGRGVRIASARVEPPAFGESRNGLLAAVARDAVPGAWPRYLRGSQSYWTVVGAVRDSRASLLSEDGAFESDKESFTLEPFLAVDGRLVTWADVTPRHSLEDGDLPIPSVEWPSTPVALVVTAAPDTAPSGGPVWVRYRLRNTSTAAARGRLYVAVRPLQVSPPWQFLNLTAGAATVRSLRATRPGLAAVNDTARVVAVTRPDAFGAMPFAGGDIVGSLGHGTLPSRRTARDSLGLASGAFAFGFALAPGDSQDVVIALPAAGTPLPPTALSTAAAAAVGTHQMAEARLQWRALVDRVPLSLGGDGGDVARAVRSSIAYILVERNGPALEPGTRSYDRSWIRDGALMSAVLLRLGHADAVREFAEWYARFQRADGYVPCCVDARGADPVPEHDSHGELIYLIAEYTRLTGDTSFARRLWPHVGAAAAVIDSLRAQPPTGDLPGDPGIYVGLLPPSISHEGYSAKPMHSYWDDFFAVRGLGDAAWLAATIGDRANAARLAGRRDDLRQRIVRSLAGTIAGHHIDFIPGSAELGDFDATSTAVAVSPVQEAAYLPEAPLRHTFDRYLADVRARRDSARGEAYTPYEFRNVAAFVRLGRAADAHEVFAALVRDRRPAEWNEWGEVVWRDVRTPRFIGDMPHAWVAAEFARSVLDMLAYERDRDTALVVGAGVPVRWTADSGVRITGMRTAYGGLDLRIDRSGDRIRVRVGGTLHVPPGGVIVRSPFDFSSRGASVDGASEPVRENGVVLRRLPAEVVFSR